jgi:hypothetical protein
MPQLTDPVINNWYKLPDSQTFRVINTDLDEGYIQIQYDDGTFEGLDADIWEKLGAETIEPTEEWLEELEQEFSELDFYEMGGAPGAEAFDLSEYYD